MLTAFAEGSTSAVSGLGDVVSDILGYMGTVVTTSPRPDTALVEPSAKAVSISFFLLLIIYL